MKRSKTATILGATGLIGSHLLKLLAESDQYERIYVITRRNTSFISPKVRELVTELQELDTLKVDQIDDAFCCLGTTMKKAGSKDAFYEVDYTFVMNYAEWALKNGAKLFSIVSAMGADRGSMFYYNRVKGEVETKLNTLDFQSLQVFRPSLLLGKRHETRLGEDFGKVMFGAFGFLMPKNMKAIKGEKVAQAMFKAATEKPNESKIYLSGQIKSFVSE